MGFLVERSTGSAPGSIDGSIEVTIDFRQPCQRDEDAERVYHLHKQGLKNSEISERLGMSRSRVRLLLNHAYAQRSLEKPDGRSNRTKRKA